MRNDGSVATKLIGVLCAAVLMAACGSSGPLLADAGDDLEILVGESPQFDGCDSTGDIDNYEWTILAAPPSMPDDVGKVIRDTMGECSFTLEAAMVSEEVGSWTIELTVTDGDETSSDTVDITVVE